MKTLLLTLLLSLPIGYLFGEDEYARFRMMEEISKAPGFAPAAFEKIIKIESKRNTSFLVKFRYEVEGRQYHVTTTPTDQKGALQYVTQHDMQVAYSTRNPAVGTLKRYFELRNPHDSLAKSLTATSILSIVMALPISLVLAWRLGWLRWAKKRQSVTPKSGQ